MKPVQRWFSRAAAVALVFACSIPAADAAAPASPAPDFAGTVSMTGAVVEGTVTQVRYTYNEKTGPRTLVTLSDVRAHVGKAPPVVVLNIFGGPLPDGRIRYIAGDPQLLPGKRYVAFLGNRPWRFSPLARGLAYRIETVAGKRVLVSDDGHPAVAVERQGITFGQTPLFAAVNAAVPEAPARLSTTSASSVAGVASVEDFVSSLRKSFPELSDSGRAPIQLEPLPMDTFARR